MKLQYHEQSLQLVKAQPEFNGEMLSDFPASIAEWYSLSNSLKLLEKYSNDDFPVHPSEFTTSRLDKKELMVFLYENQGVFWWAFEKNENDDPPVYINVDPPPDRWVLCCESFSTFVFTRLFDFLHWQDSNLIASGFGKPLEKSVLDRLRSEYITHPVTHGGVSDTQYRFSYQDQKLVIHDHGSQSSWYFSADSSAGVKNLLEKFDDMLEGHYPNQNGG